ncbi:MAG: hypothetical protein AB7H43_11065 [Acidimicrobiia bacterium]
MSPRGIRLPGRSHRLPGVPTGGPAASALARAVPVAAVLALAVALLAAAGPAGGSAPGGRGGNGGPARPTGAVAADGTVEPPPATTGPPPATRWTARHPAPGTYVVTLAPVPAPGGPAAALELQGWDAVARATVTPAGPGAVTVVFERDGQPVDTRFSFTIAPG